MSTPQIDVTPSSHLPVSIGRQQQIIDAVNDKLRKHPRQGFCFMGSPGTGKTFLMKAIRKAVMESYAPKTLSRSAVTKIITLSEWQSSMVDARLGQHAPIAQSISAKRIRNMAGRNEIYSEPFGKQGRIYPFETFHIFMDEFDSQPTVSDFAQSNLQTLVNAIYENAPRIIPGNDQDFCQLVIAMNKSWPEFEATYGTHVARRIAEMCVRIDFDRDSGVIPPKPEIPDLVPAVDSLEALL